MNCLDHVCTCLIEPLPTVGLLTQVCLVHYLDHDGPEVGEPYHVDLDDDGTPAIRRLKYSYRPHFDPCAVVV